MSPRGRSGSREGERLIEETISAWRPRAPDGRILAHPSWADLPEEERIRAYEETLRARAIERLFDNEGLTPTSRAVLLRIGG